MKVKELGFCLNGSQENVVFWFVLLLVSKSPEEENIVCSETTDSNANVRKCCESLEEIGRVGLQFMNVYQNRN